MVEPHLWLLISKTAYRPSRDREMTPAVGATMSARYDAASLKGVNKMHRISLIQLFGVFLGDPVLYILSVLVTWSCGTV